MIETITQPTDFTRVLNAPCRARSAHFAVHHLARSPAAPGGHRWAAPETTLPGDQVELSTALTLPGARPVDDFAGSRWWLGLVVPKRHARRAVTRTLLKRRIRQAVANADGLPPGMWVVRLRTPFHRAAFVSAASDILSAAVSSELQVLMSAATADIS